MLAGFILHDVRTRAHERTTVAGGTCLYHIPIQVHSDRFGGRLLAEETYVQHMWYYLKGTAADLSMLALPCIADFAPLRLKAGDE